MQRLHDPTAATRGNYLESSNFDAVPRAANLLGSIAISRAPAG